MRPLDTSPEAFEVLLALHQQRTPAERLTAGFTLQLQMEAVTAAGIRDRHPEYSDAEVHWVVVRERIADDELFHGAWPDAPLLDP